MGRRGAVSDAVRRVLRERRALILAITLTFTGVAIYFDAHAERQYVAAATIELESSSQAAPLLYSQRSKPGNTPEVQAAELGSVVLPEAYRLAARKLGKRYPGTPLAGVPIAGPAGPGLARIGVRSNDPVAGPRVANALADAVVVVARRRERASIDRVARAVNRSRRDLTRRERDAALKEVSRIDGKFNIAKFRTLRDTAVGARVLNHAPTRGLPVFSPGERVMPALIIGLSLALIAAFLCDRFTRRPRDPRRLAADAGLGAPALVPRLGRRGSDPLGAFQRLRTAIGLGTEAAPSLVAVTSPRAGEGKSTVSIGLAEAAAGAGLGACVVEADLRRPVLGERLELAGPGLQGAVAGDVPLDGALCELPTHPGTVAVLPAGPASGRPGELLPTVGMRRVLDALRERFELVIVDCPPLPAGAETSVLAAHADAVVLCARAGATPTEDLAGARMRLEHLGVRRIQPVVSGVPEWSLHEQGAGESRRSRKRRRRWLASTAAAGGDG